MNFTLHSLVVLFRTATTMVFVLVICGISSNAVGGPREDAYIMFNRINGIPPDRSILDQMTQLVQDGKTADAATLATQDSAFYNVTLKTWISPWTNEDENSNVTLNDFTATVIGVIRDDVPFDQILFGDILYTGDDALVNRATAPIAAYSLESNDHYQALTDQQLDLKTSLVRKVQSQVSALGEVAGVMSTRAFGEAFYNMGTNRAALRFTMKNFLCRDMEQLSDTSIPDFRVRHDVDRSPGGDSKVFRSKCAGCHSGMDGLSGAFAHYDFVNGALVFDDSKVHPKFLVNASTFPDGYTTTNDSWINLWTQGQNSSLGWRGPDEGNGARELGQMLTQTEAFASCMASKVFEKVCLSKPLTAEDREIVANSAAKFAQDGSFNMRQLFVNTTVACVQRQ